MGTFCGEHIFRFEPSKTTEGGTTFSQDERFTGSLGGLLMGGGFVGNALGVKESTKKGFEKYNGDLKKWCEGA
jgi:hypothetical protein